MTVRQLHNWHIWWFIEITSWGDQSISQVPLQWCFQMGSFHLSLEHCQYFFLHHWCHVNVVLDIVQPVCMVTDVKFFNFFIDPIQVLCRKVRCRGSRAVALEVDPEATGVNIALLAVDALVWALSGVKSFMQFQVHKLGKFSSAKFALIRLLSRVKPQVGLQITCAAEPFTADLIGAKQMRPWWDG